MIEAIGEAWTLSFWRDLDSLFRILRSFNLQIMKLWTILLEMFDLREAQSCLGIPKELTIFQAVHDRNYLSKIKIT